LSIPTGDDINYLAENDNVSSSEYDKLKLASVKNKNFIK